MFSMPCLSRASPSAAAQRGAAIRTGQTVYKSFKMEKISFKDEKNVENSV